MPWTGAGAGSSRTSTDTAAWPPTRARRTLHTGESLLTDRQRERLMLLFTRPDHVEVEAAWGILRRMIAAHRHADRALGCQQMAAIIETLRQGGHPHCPGRTAPPLAHPEPASSRCAGPLRPARHLQRPYRSPERPTRTPPRVRPRDSRTYYDRKRAQGKKHNAAVHRLARRRVDVQLAMLRNATPYEASPPRAA